MCTSISLLSTCSLTGTLIPYLRSSSQLRDLIICPREPGLVNYVQGYSIVEHDLYAPDIVGPSHLPPAQLLTPSHTSDRPEHRRPLV